MGETGPMEGEEIKSEQQHFAEEHQMFLEMLRLPRRLGIHAAGIIAAIFLFGVSWATMDWRVSALEKAQNYTTIPAAQVVQSMKQSIDGLKSGQESLSTQLHQSDKALSEKIDKQDLETKRHLEKIDETMQQLRDDLIERKAVEKFQKGNVH